MTEAQTHVPTIQPYLFFNGKAEQAIEFYKAALGAKVEMMMRFCENPDAPPPGFVPPGLDDKVMHACLIIGGSPIMLSDGMSMGDTNFSGFSVSIAAPTAEEAERTFAALAKGGEVQMPLGKTFFSPSFGMLKDKFGVGWMVVTVPAQGERG